MATKERKLPETMVAPETGETLVRGVGPFMVTYGSLSATVDLPGYYPAGEGDGVHVGEDMAIVDRALHALKEEAGGVPSPATIRRVRDKLKLTRREAGVLFGVGEKAFGQYERGVVQPSGPMIQLMRLLDRHPDLVHELQSF